MPVEVPTEKDQQRERAERVIWMLKLAARELRHELTEHGICTDRPFLGAHPLYQAQQYGLSELQSFEDDEARETWILELRLHVRAIIEQMIATAVPRALSPVDLLDPKLFDVQERLLSKSLGIALTITRQKGDTDYALVVGWS